MKCGSMNSYSLSIIFKGVKLMKNYGNEFKVFIRLYQNTQCEIKKDHTKREMQEMEIYMAKAENGKRHLTFQGKVYVCSVRTLLTLTQLGLCVAHAVNTMLKCLGVRPTQRKKNLLSVVHTVL